MITNPVARTRALYKWEDDLVSTVLPKPGLLVENHGWFWSDVDSNESAMAMWFRLGMWHNPPKESCPRVHLRHGLKRSYCYGRADIYLAFTEANQIILLHELIHAKGYGSEQNPHNKAFVVRYAWTLFNVFPILTLGNLFKSLREGGLL